MILERGTLLNNRYRIVEILGQGGMGSVYRAVDENLGVEVAVKDNLFTTEEYARQFRREAVILATLRHANLPRVTDHFVITGQGQYLVMDYIEGEDLRQRMEREGALPDEDVINIGAAVCDALAYLASRKPSIIHRDIKPGNVRITPQGQIYLVDFGLAKTLHSGSHATTTGARAMTPGFSPPEQYGTARTDHRSDIFSLGATLYAALTGATPEDALTRAMDQVELTPIRKFNSRVSRKLSAAIEKAVEVRPDDRYQSGEDFKQALLSASAVSRRRDGEYVVAPPPAEEKAIPTENPLLPTKEEEAQDAQPLELPPQLFPASKPLDEFTSGASRPRARKRSGSRGCWVVLLIILLLLSGVGVGVYLYDPALASEIMSNVWPLVFEPMATPTSFVSMADFTATPINVESAAPPTFTPTATSTQTAVPTFTATTTNTPMPTDTPTPVPTPMGGGGVLAFSSDETNTPQIYLTSVEGGERTQVTNIPEGACQPSWSPDGKQIVFISPCDSNKDYYQGSALYLINPDGSGMQPLPTLAGGDYDPAWSPDGKRIAFTSLRNSGRPQIYILNLETNEVVALSEKFSVDSQPAWSKDGKQIIFVTNRRGTPQIWVMDADGQNQHQFSSSQSYSDTKPSWSPDGQTVVFTQFLRMGAVPWVAIAPYAANPYVEYRLGQDPFPMREAVFSPDGLWIAFEGWTAEGGHDIYVIAVTGAGRRQITTGGRYDFDVAWRPVP